MPRRPKLFRGGRKKFPHRLGSTLVLLLLISAYQIYDQGRFSWHQTIIAEIRDYADQLVRDWHRPDHPAPPAQQGQQLTGRVIKVTDGDTFVLLTPDWYEYTVRLHGIDAPEYDQPHGAVATQALTGMLDDKNVSVTIEDIDNYGRQVGQVFLDGSDINLAMVRDGHAWWYKQYAKANSGLAQAEMQARGSRSGLWADQNPAPPWLWRRKR